MKEFDYIDGKLVEPAQNDEDIVIELNYDPNNTDSETNEVKPQLSTNKLRLVGRNAKTAYNHYLNGKVLAGLPYKKDIENRVNGVNTRFNLFDGYIDLTDDTEFNNNDMTVTIKDKRGIDFISDRVDGISHEYLYSIGVITSDDFIYLPYCKSQDTFKTIFTLISCVSTIIMMVQEITIIESEIIRVNNPLEAASIGALILHSAFYLVQLLTFIQTIKTLYDLVVQPVKYHAAMYVRVLFEKLLGYFGKTFISPIFAIDSEFYNLVLLPEKSSLATIDKENKSFSFLSALGFKGASNLTLSQRGYDKINKELQKGFYKADAGTFLRAFLELFNAKPIVTETTFYFLRKDQNPAGFNLSKSFRVQDIVPDDMVEKFRSNVSTGYYANYLYSFQKDLSDKNTIENYTGRDLQLYIKPENAAIDLSKGFKRTNFQFALATAKTELNLPEKILEILADCIDFFIGATEKLINAAVAVANAVIGIYNSFVDLFETMIKILKKTVTFISFGSADLSFTLTRLKLNPMKPVKFDRLGGIIENRIGMLQLQEDEFDVQKLLIVNPNTLKLADNNRSVVSAKNIFNKFHILNTFAPLNLDANGNLIIDYENGLHNQWEKRLIEKHRFVFTDFEKLRINNTCRVPERFNPKNELSVIDSAKWNRKKSKAEIIYSVNKLNPKIKFSLKTIEADGN